MPRIQYDSFYIDASIIELNKHKVQILKFVGKITYTNAYIISKEIGEVFTEKVYNIILDLSSLEHLNSIGLAIVLTISKTVEQHSGKFMIGGVNPLIETVVKLMELSDQISIHSTVDLALQEFERLNE